MQIQPHFQPVGALLSDRLFRIPEFQRAYSWLSKHRSDLFSDIRKIYRKVQDSNGDDTSHFMATVVGLRRGKKRVGADEFTEIEVVDGQQRLTTLTILLKAISKALNRADKNEAKIAKEIDELLVKHDELSLLLLQTNHDSTHIFTDYLRNGVNPTDDRIQTAADQNLVAAIRECEGFVEQWTETPDSTLIDLYGIIKNRLSVIFHEIEDEALVYTVFEVLNSRGLDVTWFDKLKSLLMAIVFEYSNKGTKGDTIKELHNLWTDVYRAIGLRNLNRETVRFAGTLHVSKPLAKAATQETERPISVPPNKLLDEESAVVVLTNWCEGHARKVVECTKWLLRITQAEDRLLGDARRKAVTYVVQARLVGVAILLRKFPEAKEQALLRRWENVTFRIYGLGRKDSRTKVGDYVRLAWRIINEDLTAKAILEELEEIGEDHPVEKVVEELRQNCYDSWAEQLRYFLFRYEEHLAEQNGQSINESMWRRIWDGEPSRSIEHILPRSKGSEEPSTKNIFVHRLGNLTMLLPGVNSKLQDKDPKYKIKAYKQTGLLLTIEVGNLIKKRGKWDIAAVEKRERRLMKWARTEWAS